MSTKPNSIDIAEKIEKCFNHYPVPTELSIVAVAELRRLQEKVDFAEKLLSQRDASKTMIVNKELFADWITRAETAEREVLELTDQVKSAESSKETFLDALQSANARIHTLEAISKDLGVRLTGFNSWVSHLVGRDNEEERLPAIKKYVENLMAKLENMTWERDRHMGLASHRFHFNPTGESHKEIKGKIATQAALVEHIKDEILQVMKIEMPIAAYNRLEKTLSLTTADLIEEKKGESQTQREKWDDDDFRSYDNEEGAK